MGLYMATLGGMILKADHSFKVPKRVRDSTGGKQFAAVLTIMNEFCQVRESWCPRGRVWRSATSHDRGARPEARRANGHTARVDHRCWHALQRRPRT